jgi:hypothetical protein
MMVGISTLGLVRPVTAVLLSGDVRTFFDLKQPFSNITSSQAYSFDLSSPFNSTSTISTVGEACVNIFLCHC